MKKSKKGLGVVVGLFAGLLGLLVWLAFPQNSEERETYIKGWTIGFIVGIVVWIILIIVLYSFVFRL